MNHLLIVVALITTILGGTRAQASPNQAGKDESGRAYYSACVYREENGIYDDLCDEADHNKKFAEPKDANGCFASQTLIRSYAPIPFCPTRPIH